MANLNWRPTKLNKTKAATFKLEEDVLSNLEQYTSFAKKIDVQISNSSFVNSVLRKEFWFLNEKQKKSNEMLRLVLKTKFFWRNELSSFSIQDRDLTARIQFLLKMNFKFASVSTVKIEKDYLEIDLIWESLSSIEQNLDLFIEYLEITFAKHKNYKNTISSAIWWKLFWDFKLFSLNKEKNKNSIEKFLNTFWA